MPQAPTENLYEQLTRKERFNLLVPMMIEDKDGNELHLPMVILTAREEREAKTAAYNETVAYFKSLPKKEEAGNTIFDQVHDNNFACYLLLKVVRLPNDLSKPFFTSKQQIEDQYTSDQLGILSNAFMTVQLNQPHIKHLKTENELADTDAAEDLIRQIIAAGKKDFFLNGYTTHSLKLLIQYLVCQLETLRKDNGSVGSLSNETMKSE